MYSRIIVGHAQVYRGCTNNQIHKLVHAQVHNYLAFNERYLLTNFITKYHKLDNPKRVSNSL